MKFKNVAIVIVAIALCGFAYSRNRAMQVDSEPITIVNSLPDVYTTVVTTTMPQQTTTLPPVTISLSPTTSTVTKTALITSTYSMTNPPITTTQYVNGGTQYITTTLPPVILTTTITKAVTTTNTITTTLTSTTIGIGSLTVNNGSNFQVDVTISPLVPIAGAQFNLSFNPNLVNVNSISEGNLFKQNGAQTYFMAGNIDNVAGTIKNVACSIIGNNSVSSQGILATIYFTAKSVGDCPLILSNVIVANQQAQSVNTTINNGDILIR